MADAARVGDKSTCPLHVAGVILPPAAGTVSANLTAKARATDRLLCGGGIPDFIVTGSATVLVHGLPAARVGSKTLHGGTVMTGSSNVDVGGDWIGATFGNFAASKAVFNAMAAGRNPPPGTTYPNGMQIPAHTPTQSYNNCGIESSRQLIRRATGSQVTQESLLNEAMSNGWATKDPSGLYNSGGSWATGRAQLLVANGVPAHTEAPTMENLTQAVAEKKGVSADVWAAKIWPANVVASMNQAPNSNTLAHAITVTGMDFDNAGQLKTVFINDTGMGTVNQPIPAAQFAGALMGPTTPSTHLVTDKPIW